MMTEKWKWIPGYKGLYKVSSFGRVRSVNRTVTTSNGRKVRLKGNFRRFYVDKHGYYCVTLSKQGSIKSHGVHGLVLRAFVGKRVQELQACHNDGNPMNNHLSNLRYDTPKENSNDRHAHGTAQVGTAASGTKLTKKQVLKIRKLYATSKYTYKQLANRFDVCTSTIGAIVKHRTFKNLSDSGEELPHENFLAPMPTKTAQNLLAFGKEQKLKDWAKETGIPNSTLHRRLQNGLTLEEAIQLGQTLKKYTAFGKTLSISEWAKKTGIDGDTLRYRLTHNWEVEEALTTKPKIGNRWRNKNA